MKGVNRKNEHVCRKKSSGTGVSEKEVKENRERICLVKMIRYSAWTKKIYKEHQTAMKDSTYFSLERRKRRRGKMRRIMGSRRRERLQETKTRKERKRRERKSRKR